MRREPTILVVDDEKINLMVLQGILQAAGLKALTASNGQDGRRMALEHKPDLILLDIMMPEENGFETCMLLKQEPLVTDIPLIFISALSDVENKVRGLEIGAVDYITKPFERDEVLARVRLHLKLEFARRAIIEEQANRLKQLTDAQQAILVSPDEYPDADFAIEYVPALEAGGDFYDVFPSGKNSFCYFIADVCGHDLGASFITSSLKALLHQNSGPLYTPLETMKNINSVLNALLQSGKYLTAQSCYVDRRAMKLTLLNAGHLAPVLVKADGGGGELEAEGDILGAFESIWIKPLTIDVAPGDRIFLYTDGLIERFGGEQRTRIAGMEKMIALCRDSAHLPLRESMKVVIDGMCPKGGDVQDDVVLLGVNV